MSQTISVFQVPVYMGRLQNQKVIEEKFAPIMAKSKNFAPTPNWDCPVKSTLNVSNNAEHPWHYFTNEVVDYHLKEFLSTITDRSPWNNIKVQTNCWMNKYEKGDYQEPHNHTSLGIAFSCAYMLKLPEDTGSNNLRFKWTGNDWFQTTGLADLFERTPGSIWVPPQQNEGDIFIFPSHLEHFVTRNGSKQARFTISANFYLFPDNLENKEYSLQT